MGRILPKINKPTNLQLGNLREPTIGSCHYNFTASRVRAPPLRKERRQHRNFHRHQLFTSARNQYGRYRSAEKLEQLKAKVQAEGGEILANSAVVGHDNNRLTEVLEKEMLKKEKLAEKRAERERKKKEAKGIV